MRILFISSGNRGGVSPIISAQGKSIESLGLKLNYFEIKGTGFIGYLSNIPRLRKYILKNNLDVIHAHYSYCGIVAVLTFTRKPIVVSLMGSDIKSGFILKQIIKLFSKYCWKKTIVKSDSMLSDSGVKQAQIIPNGVNLKKFNTQTAKHDKTKFNFSVNKLTILFLANPSRESKNFQLANHAFREIEYFKAELQVRYNIPQNQIPDVINAADIILLTSKWEGSPNVVKEAMACNCPIVATNVGDIEWLFGNEPGHFVTSFEPYDVTEKLKEAIEFSSVHGRTNGRKRIIDLGIDSKSVAKRIVKVYEEALKE